MGRYALPWLFALYELDRHAYPLILYDVCVEAAEEESDQLLPTVAGVLSVCEHPQHVSSVYLTDPAVCIRISCSQAHS